ALIVTTSQFLLKPTIGKSRRGALVKPGVTAYRNQLPVGLLVCEPPNRIRPGLFVVCMHTIQRFWTGSYVVRGSVSWFRSALFVTTGFQNVAVPTVRMVAPVVLSWMR